MLISIKDICTKIAEEFDITPTKQNIELNRLDKLHELISPTGNQHNFVCIGARAGMGKTALSLDIAIDAAAHSDKSVLIFSLELAAEAVVMWMIQKLSGVNLSKFKNLTMDAENKTKFSVAISFLQKLNILIDDEAEASPLYIKKCIRGHKNIGLIIVDFIQLLHPDKHCKSKQKEQCETAKKLALIVEKYAIKALIFTQLYRTACTRNRPIIDDILYSDQLAPSSDIIAFIYRNSYYSQDSTDDSAEIIVAKNSFDECRVIKLRFDADTMSFKELN